MTEETVVSGAEQQAPDTRPMILVGVDGSEDGLRATRYGARVAGTRARLHLVHAVDDAVLAGAWGVVYDPTILQQAGEKATEAAVAAALETGIDAGQVTSEVVLGNAAAVLARQSETAALMVLGRRSVSGIERMFVGSTSVAAVASAHCPTVVVSQAVNPDPTGQYGRVVVGLDAGPHAGRTLEWAMAEAQARGAKLEVVHVSEPKSTGFFGRGAVTDEAKRTQMEAARDRGRAGRGRGPGQDARCRGQRRDPLRQSGRRPRRTHRARRPSGSGRSGARTRPGRGGHGAGADGPLAVADLPHPLKPVR